MNTKKSNQYYNTCATCRHKYPLDNEVCNSCAIDDESLLNNLFGWETGKNVQPSKYEFYENLVDKCNCCPQFEGCRGRNSMQCSKLKRCFNCTNYPCTKGCKYYSIGCKRFNHKEVKL